jgi:hypothetical protein
MYCEAEYEHFTDNMFHTNTYIHLNINHYGTWSNRHLPIVYSAPSDSQFGTYVYIFFHLYIGKL